MVLNATFNNISVFKAVGCGVSQKYQNWGKNGK
jgi:hypothetical protein